MSEWLLGFMESIKIYDAALANETNKTVAFQNAVSDAGESPAVGDINQIP